MSDIVIRETNVRNFKHLKKTTDKNSFKYNQGNLVAIEKTLSRLKTSAKFPLKHFASRNFSEFQKKKKFREGSIPSS